MNRIDRWTLSDSDRRLFEKTAASPVRILQIGEGNFLRGFVDWMIHVCQSRGLFDGSIAVTQPRPSGKNKIDRLARQDGIYTLVTRGLIDGSPVEVKDIISVFSQVFDPYSEWGRLVQLAVSPDLRIVVSNTTEAGLAYRPESLTDGPIESFPGKIAYLLHCRYMALKGSADSGLIFLPCELLEKNGDTLRETVLRYAADWGFSADFRRWVVEYNRFLNSLVDRIVTGRPDEEQAESWFAEWGYRDDMLNTAEPYHLWAIEGEPELEELLPFRAAGLNVHWTDDLKPFQQRKVRILNGCHTWMAPLGLLNGVEYVGDLLMHKELGKLARETVLREIVPTLPYSEADMREYADSVFERFANPYIRHRLADIAMNSLSKFKVRLLPSMAYYAEQGKPVPELLALGLAGLLRFYKVKRGAAGGFEGVSLGGVRYAVRDDESALQRIADLWETDRQGGEPIEETVRNLLADTTLWGQDLSVWPGLTMTVAGQMAAWEGGVGK
jgi:tagaturonate reductase